MILFSLSSSDNHNNSGQPKESFEIKQRKLKETTDTPNNHQKTTSKCVQPELDLLPSVERRIIVRLIEARVTVDMAKALASARPIRRGVSAAT